MREKISSFTIASSLKTSSGYPFAHPLVYGLAILCVMTTLSFVWIENKALEPILPMSLLTRLQPSLVLAAFVLLTSTMFARASWQSLSSTCKLTITIKQIYMQPVYLHVTRGLNGSQTGLLLLPSDIVGSASSLYAGWHMRVRDQHFYLVDESSRWSIHSTLKSTSGSKRSCR